MNGEVRQALEQLNKQEAAILEGTWVQQDPGEALRNIWEEGEGQVGQQAACLIVRACVTEERSIHTEEYLFGKDTIERRALRWAAAELGWEVVLTLTGESAQYDEAGNIEVLPGEFYNDNLVSLNDANDIWKGFQSAGDALAVIARAKQVVKECFGEG